MVVGSVIGAITFFCLSWGYNYLTGFLPERINPYISTFPMMRSVCFAWIGFVIGALVGLIK